MVAVAQRLERLPVEQEVGGSIPLSHPSLFVLKILLE
ncbi:MAG: hypothetical protein UX13_C0039G0014 [Candidatus Woesebacteria bacterium GW2011_GWB1_45_5]|uniref:Uncharacterized protein n=1 Tax=Candidatus Woesebacteria bacterium GW2011_GWB1_45_5 TaxID=1618581 RepID=A0A0G1MMR8_9BACT|nr:MAG: hypothetical protein UX13_C0039G0014 [Candidatus Woesebacteria bacterium GW2011_GWB1_45_5]